MLDGLCSGAAAMSGASRVPQGCLLHPAARPRSVGQSCRRVPWNSRAQDGSVWANTPRACLMCAWLCVLIFLHEHIALLAPVFAAVGVHFLLMQSILSAQ